MKKFNLALLFFSATTLLSLTPLSLAATRTTTVYSTTVYGNVTDFGYCSGFNYDFCLYQLKATTERDASDQMATSCSIQSGTLQSFPYCSTSCFPFYLPQNAPMQSVNCSSQCTGTCEIKN